MTLFEYLSVAVSIVLSLSAAQILGSLREVLAREQRSLVHTGWVAVVLFTHIIIWWEFWAFREATNWTLATFVIVLVNPALLYVASNALVVDDERLGATWEERFFALRGSIFVPFALLLPIAILRDWIVFGTPFEFPRHLPEVAMTILLLLAWRLRNRHAHIAILIAAFLILASSSLLVWLRPGGGSQI